MDIKLFLDVVVSILLAVTIAYAAMLHSRLGQLRKNREDLAKLVAAFNEATARAEGGIPKLRRAADEAGAALQERVEKAQSLRDDLAFMIERADAMANRLESGVKSARDGLKPSPGSAVPPRPSVARPATPPPAAPAFAVGAAPVAATAEDFEDERSEAERELLRALQSVR